MPAWGHVAAHVSAVVVQPIQALQKPFSIRFVCKLMRGAAGAPHLLDKLMCRGASHWQSVTSTCHSA